MGPPGPVTGFPLPLPLFCRFSFLMLFLFSYLVLLCTLCVFRAAYVTGPRDVESARN
jgi:hypothetical protein